ncbi:MAG: GntR family transcriptional regulator [Verrucomicrobiae bacterium]
MGSPKNESARQRANRRLLACVARLSAAGEEWLPGERSLCAELGVSIITVRSAIKQLVLEGLVESVPRKGNRLCRPVKKSANVGIVLSNQEDVSFVHAPLMMMGIFDVLARRRECLRIIELRDFQKAPGVFKKLRLDACIVFVPERKLYPKIAEAMKASGIAVLPLLGDWSEGAESLPCYVTADTRGALRAQAEFLARSGCKNVARWNASQSPTPGQDFPSFKKAFARAGLRFKPEWTLSANAVAVELPGLLDAGKIDSAIVHGGLENMRRVFEILDRHERGGDIVLLVDDVGDYLAEFWAAYPKVNVAGVHCHPTYEIGLAAARAIGDFLDKGKPLGRIEVPYSIQSLE